MKANDIRKGNVIYYEGKPHLVMDFTHRTPGNLRAFVQVRLRNLTNGMSLDHRFSATEVVETARLDTKAMQVLYADTNGVHVMDAQTYEQFTFDPEVVGDEHERTIDLVTQIAQQREDLRLHRDVERSGRLVGNHEVGG